MWKKNAWKSILDNLGAHYVILQVFNWKNEAERGVMEREDSALLTCFEGERAIGQGKWVTPESWKRHGHNHVTMV